jgi:hypothetical protein
MTPYRIDVHHCVIPGLVEQLARAGVHQIGGAALPAWTFEDSIAMMACFDPVFEDFPGRHQQRAALGPRVRPDQSGAHRGARPPARGGPDRRGAADRGPELRQLEPRAQGRAGQEQGLPARPPTRRPRSHPRLAAIRQLEVAMLARHGIEGVVLCYANFYGPAKEMASFVVLSCLVRCR